MDKPNGKTNTQLEKIISVTEVFDVKGYQHRYKVKEFLDNALVSFEDYFAKKN